MRLGKNVGWSTLVAAAGAVVMLFAAQGAMAVITGSAHDFKAKTWNPSGEICNVCHAPHNTASSSLLWNHATTASSYTMYSSSSLTATGLAVGAGSVSKLCLSCHDGTVAIDSFGGATGTVTIGTGVGANAKANLLNGTSSLTDDHPIGFAYTAALATSDGGLVTPTSVSLVSAGVPLYGGTGQLECASCHDVHNAPNVAKLLRVANTGSALCLKCHSK